MNFSKKILATFSVASLLLSSINPASLVFADTVDTSVKSSVTNSEGYASTIAFDGRTLVEVLDSSTIRLTYDDGGVDLLEKREDGVYKNGELFIANSTLNQMSSGIGFRTANSWVVVSSSSGRSDRNNYSNNVIGSLMGSILGLVGGGPIGSLIGAITTYLPTASSPGAYDITTIYFNRSRNQFKIVSSYYENSNFTGYVTTTTNYVTVPS